MIQSLTPRRIVTHKRPDVDALVSVWLAERFLFTRQLIEVLFIDYGCDVQRLSGIDCAVDVGGVYCKKRLIFDHKPPAFINRHQTCAAKLLWKFLKLRGDPVEHLKCLIEAVHDGDSSKRRPSSIAYRQSRRNGVHAAYCRWKSGRIADTRLYGKVKNWLDEQFGRDK